MLSTILMSLRQLMGSYAGPGEPSRVVSELAVSDRSKGVFSAAVGHVDKLDKLSLPAPSRGRPATSSSLRAMINKSGLGTSASPSRMVKSAVRN